MSKYNVGDMVRIKHTDYEDCGLDVGTVHSVVLDKDGDVCLMGAHSELLFFYDWELEPAIAPQTQAQTPEFKAYINILEFNAGDDAVRYARQVSGYNP